MSEIPRAESDGTFDMEFITRRIAEHQRQCRAQTQSPGEGLPEVVSPLVMSWLDGLGIQTCQDVTTVWMNANGFTVEMEVALGSEVVEPHACQLARVWQLSRKAAQEHLQGLAEAVVGERLSTSTSGRRSAPVISRPAPKVMPSGVRTMLVTGTGPVDAPQTVAAVVAAPFAKEEAV